MLDLYAERHADVVYSVDTDEPVVALTIDDGPDPVSTRQILDVLARHDARATFFLIAERVPGNEVVEAIVDAGHEVGNHLTRDEPSIDLEPEAFERELLEAHRVLSGFAAPRWFRPGSGWHDDAMLEILERHAYRCALGSAYPLDAQVPSTWFATRVVLWRAEPGAIIILHDRGARGERTVQTLERLLPELGRRGYRVVSLSELERRAIPPAR
jgi:peptidoglycan/xylan/chitin deacetylase (PgdA/CDA1 family)